MVLKVYLNNSLGSECSTKQIHLKDLFIFLIAILIFSTGCASSGLNNIQQDENRLPSPEKIETDTNTHASDSRINASHSLTKNGYLLLCEKDFDGAIRLLEKAVGINPSDGPGYYYLAEAWIEKKNYKLAFQFNRLAFIYLRNDKTWMRLAESQKERIEEVL